MAHGADHHRRKLRCIGKTYRWVGGQLSEKIELAALTVGTFLSYKAAMTSLARSCISTVRVSPVVAHTREI